MSEIITHALVLITVNAGYSEDVMTAARSAGATGGTILRGLKCSPAEAARRFGLPLQDEQEIIAIVANAEDKTAIMTAISQQYGIDTPAHGLAVAVPVDAIMGL